MEKVRKVIHTFERYNQLMFSFYNCV